VSIDTSNKNISFYGFFGYSKTERYTVSLLFWNDTPWHKLPVYLLSEDVSSQEDASTSWPSSSGLKGHRMIYNTILEAADHALYKMVRYVLLRPLRPELEGQDVEASFPRRHVFVKLMNRAKRHARCQLNWEGYRWTYHMPHHAEGLVNPKVHGLKNRNWF
jgi:hypothetical protein